ncbi:hypothetical protein [Sedimentitalea arenosa]|uniref:YkuD domain-containing protein n=1 Tax=Sedimentitalea arenosa TaxID=2798803 RepID=A0A8J7LRM3_9RHOB|nr:hypothetical protein [Arenibacterium arenosum]MBJ6371034.1 hypothetical protein [Arenibacterium arenosum]
MSQTRFLIATLFCLLPALGPLSAQGLSGPADSPPPGFAGTEYVDGRGCVFARASIDGVVTWVPRRDATRVQVCGRTPTRTAAMATPAPRSAAAPAGQTRIIPRHVYDNRRNTVVMAVPRGYRPAWDDGRLNPHRTEMILAPSMIRPHRAPPAGFTAGWGDGRLNPHRGVRSAQGEAQTDRIWTRTVPRSLRPLPTDVPVVQIDRSALPQAIAFQEPGPPIRQQAGGLAVTRLSTRAGDARFPPKADR